MSSLCRGYGGATFELEGEAALLERALRVLGESGWSEGRAAGDAVRVSLEARGDRLLWRSTELGREYEAAEAEALAELELATVDHAVRAAPSPATLHAACLARAGGLLLLVGPHGSGKTTLSLALVERGLTLLGDDLVFVSAAGEARALPRPLRIRPGSPPLLPVLGERVLELGHHDAYNQIHWLDPSCLDGAPGPDAPVADVVVARYVAGSPTVLAPAGAAETLAALLPHVFAERASEPACVAAIAAMLGSARCHRLEHGLPPTEAATLLLGALEGG